MNRRSWDAASVKAISSHCKNRRDLQINYPGAYKAAVRLGILAQLFPDLAQIQWTEEMLRAEAAKYTSRGEFATKSPSAYVISRTRGLLDAICPPAYGRKHTTDSVRQIGLTYETRTDFARQDPGAYSYAQRQGILNEVCPPNVGGTSRGEQALLSFLQSIEADFTKRRFGRGYELDCYSETLKLGVEYNGLYWHSEATRKMTPNYHLKKTQFFEEKGIRVIHIWEHEWSTRQNQVKNYLKSACGANENRIGARKCEFKAIGALEAKDFMEAVHIQGRPNHVLLALGAYHLGQLVAVTTFGHHHRLGKRETVLNRFASLPGHTVAGCLNKMTKMAFAQLGPLKSWADYSKSQGTGYIAAGWTVEKLLKPDYFYTDKRNEVVSKQARMKHKMKTPVGMSEHQHALADGLFRIWDCGKLVMTYNGTP